MQMKIKTPLMDHFRLKTPIIVAPMAGGPTTPELVAACSNYGALGSLAGAYLNAEQLSESIKKTKSLTQNPFLINLFAPVADPLLSESVILTAIHATKIFRNQLGLPTPEFKPPFHLDFDKQFEVVLKEKPAAFSFIFGLLDEKYISECKKRSIFVIGTSTNLEEGMALEASGVDAVIAQGVDAGAHRGMFHSDDLDPMMGTSTLTRLFVKHLKIPVISAGGIMDGFGIAASMVLGAQAAQLGTAFLACKESGVSKVYRDVLLSAKRTETKFTRAFSGRLARGIENRFMREMDSHKEAILPFPAQNAFTRDIRNKANSVQDVDFLSLWAGSGVSMLREASASELLDELSKEIYEAIEP